MHVKQALGYPIAGPIKEESENEAAADAHSRPPPILEDAPLGRAEEDDALGRADDDSVGRPPRTQQSHVSHVSFAEGTTFERERAREFRFGVFHL